MIPCIEASATTAAEPQNGESWQAGGQYQLLGVCPEYSYMTNRSPAGASVRFSSSSADVGSKVAQPTCRLIVLKLLGLWWHAFVRMNVCRPLRPCNSHGPGWHSQTLLRDARAIACLNA